MKKTCKILVGLATLALTLISLWATFKPVTVLAASASAKCANGSTITCTGDSCTSQDSTPSSNGFCYCTRIGTTPDVKFCANIGVPPPSRPPTD